MIEEIQEKLKLAVNFPSPPAIAQQIIELAADPDIEVGKVAAAIARDPGLTAKVLRVANSPLYSNRRRSDNLRQALIVLGLNAATTLALSFSLLKTYQGVQSNGIDYGRFWRRTILCASAARAFGAFKSEQSLEDIFLAALLQDIGIIAIDRVEPDFYRDISKTATHAQMVAHEVERLGTDHAALGAWLLRHWKLAEPLCRSVESSHAPAAAEGHSGVERTAHCVALASDCVELLLAPVPAAADMNDLAARAVDWLGMSPQSLSATMTQIIAEIPEIERLFDTRLLDAPTCACILDQARELLMIRNLQAIEQVGSLQRASEYFQSRAAEFEDKHRRDSLTGVYNRRRLDEVLSKEFDSAVAGGWPLSVIFADLDGFKRINDTYGHSAGDTVLVETAKLILAVVRETDCVARYGGEEFVIVLPGLDALPASKMCERLLASLRNTSHELAGGTLTVTASLGLATHGAGTPFASVAGLLEAADRSLYAAKRAGRDRMIRYEMKSAVGAASRPTPIIAR